MNASPTCCFQPRPGRNGYVRFYLGAYREVDNHQNTAWKWSSNHLSLFENGDCDSRYSFMCDRNTFGSKSEQICVALFLYPDRDEGKWELSGSWCNSKQYVLCQGITVKSGSGEAANAELMDEEEVEKWIRQGERSEEL